jgi:hypothetical protein
VRISPPVASSRHSRGTGSSRRRSTAGRSPAAKRSTRRSSGSSARSHSRRSPSSLASPNDSPPSPGAADCARVVAPLGVGGHVDHRIVRAAAERAFGGALLYYEEFPYIVWKPFALLRAGIFGRSWSALRQPLAAGEIAARIAAIACYASQVTPLFRSPDRIGRLVGRHVRRAGGERLWRRLEARGAQSFAASGVVE